MPHPLLAVTLPGKMQGLRKVLEAGTYDWVLAFSVTLCFPT